MSLVAYEIAGVPLTVAAPDGPARDAIHARLAAFAADPPPDGGLRFEVLAARDGHAVERPRGDGREVYPWEPGEVSYFDDAGLLYMSVGEGARLLASPRGGWARLSATATALDDPWLLARPLLTLPLVELLKWRGRYSLHAAGAAAGGRAIVLAGASGSGKSTLGVALAQRGLDFMGDDMLFLSAEAGEVTVHGFPEEIDVAPESAAWLDGMEALRGPAPEGWPKHRVAARDVARAVALTARPAAIVLPRVADAPASRLTRASAADALVELGPNVLLTDAGMAQRHLDVLGALARSAPAYHLATGTDVPAAAAALAALLGT